MDFKNLYLSAAGRLGQKDFWLGWVILLVINLVVGFVTKGLGNTGAIISTLIGLVVLYAFYCILAKRFQDSGKNGRTLAAIPCGIFLIVNILGLLVALGLMGGMAMNSASTDMSAMTTGAMAGAGLVGILALLGIVIGLVFLLWAGLSKGDPAPNAYGPPPAPVFGSKSAA